MAVTEHNQHIVPRWTGKALGAALGMALAPASPTAYTAWLLGGLALGHSFDSLGVQIKESARVRRCPEDVASSLASLRFTFAALGRIAAASGEVRLDHLECSERLMARLAFSPARRIEARGWFQEGRNPEFDFDGLAPACRAELDAHPVLKDLSARCLCRITALADSPGSLTTLFTVADQAGLDRRELVNQLAALTEPSAGRSPAEHARETLGVRAEDSPEAIRLAYRRRIGRWRPERFPADAPKEVHALAEARVRELDDALTVLTWIGGGRR